METYTLTYRLKGSTVEEFLRFPTREKAERYANKYDHWFDYVALDGPQGEPVVIREVTPGRAKYVTPTRSR